MYSYHKFDVEDIAPTVNAFYFIFLIGGKIYDGEFWFSKYFATKKYARREFTHLEPLVYGLADFIRYFNKWNKTHKNNI